MVKVFTLGSKEKEVRMFQETAIGIVVKQATGIVIDHAILHHLDPDGKGMGELLVDSELDFAGQYGPIVRERLERFVQHAYEGSHLTAVSLDDIAADSTSTTLGICWNTLDDPADFVKASRELAGRLTRAMRTRPNISEGDLFLVIAHDALGPMVGILKLEKWTELVREFVPQVDGTLKAVVVPNQDVIHTRTIPQKCAFVRRPSHQHGPYVRLNDNQARDHETPARFFIERFLECRIITTMARRTIDFCIATESWRQEHALYLPKQGIVTVARALQTHLEKPELTFTDFAHELLAGATLSAAAFESLVSHLASSVYPPEPGRNTSRSPIHSFQPDPETVGNLLREMDLTLSDGTRIIGSSSTMLRKLESLIVDKEEGPRKITIPLQTNSVTRRFPGSSLMRPRASDDFQSDEAN